MSEKDIYKFYSPHTCHEDTDDCAICYASSKKEAIEIFSKMYHPSGYKMEKCVEKLFFNNLDIGILGEY